MRLSHTIALLGACAIALIGCGPSGTQTKAPPPGPVTINVGILGASWTDRLSKAVQPQMDAAGIKVNYVAGGAEEWLPRLLAARDKIRRWTSLR